MLGVGGGRAPAAHTADGIIRGRSVCRRRWAVLRGWELDIEIKKRDVSQWIGFRGDRNCPGDSVVLAVGASLRAPAIGHTMLGCGAAVAQRSRPRRGRSCCRGRGSLLAGEGRRLLPVANSLGPGLLQIAARALANPFDFLLDALHLAFERLLDLIDLGERLLELAGEIGAHAPEVTHPSADLAGKLGQPAWSEDDQRDYQDDEHFLVSNAKHGRFTFPGRNSCPGASNMSRRGRIAARV